MLHTSTGQNTVLPAHSGLRPPFTVGGRIRDGTGTASDRQQGPTSTGRLGPAVTLLQYGRPPRAACNKKNFKPPGAANAA